MLGIEVVSATKICLEKNSIFKLGNICLFCKSLFRKQLVYLVYIKYFADNQLSPNIFTLHLLWMWYGNQDILITLKEFRI